MTASLVVCQIAAASTALSRLLAKLAANLETKNKLA